MMTNRSSLARAPLAAGVLLLGACTVMPVGPTVMALPGSRMSVEQYQADTVDCQNYANSVVSSASGGVAANADNRAASSAVSGAAVEAGPASCAACFERVPALPTARRSPDCRSEPVENASGLYPSSDAEGGSPAGRSRVRAVS